MVRGIRNADQHFGDHHRTHPQRPVLSDEARELVAECLVARGYEVNVCVGHVHRHYGARVDAMRVISP